MSMVDTVPESTSALVRLRGRRNAVTPTSVELANSAARGESPTLLEGQRALDVRFDDIVVRARRLLSWAAEESAYVRTHPVGSFSQADRDGRSFFADEGLYQLLPALRRSLFLLVSRVGPGPMTQEAGALVQRACADVQAYYLLWTTARDNAPAA